MKKTFEADSIELGQKLLNQVGSILSVYPTNNLFIKSIPVIISVFNELITFTDGQIVEERLQELENMIKEMQIDLKHFKEKVEHLEIHDQFVLRNNVKDLCLSALPETTEIRAMVIIEFVMGTQHELGEEICEIATQLNKNDMDVLFRIYDIVNDEAITKRRKTQAQEKIEKNKGERWKDRIFYVPEKTVLWADFLGQDTDDVPQFSDMIIQHWKTANGDEDYSFAMMCRALLKLQRLGVIDIDTQMLMGDSPINNIQQFHLTVFGDKLLEYVARIKMKEF